MAFSINAVHVRGNLGGDPDIKSTSGGKQFANFSVATSEKWTDKNSGEKKEKTEWHRVVVWNDWTVKTVAKCKKGNQVDVIGKLQTRKWEKDGQDHYATEIVVQGFGCDVAKIEWTGDSNRQATPEHTDADFSGPGSGGGGGAATAKQADLDDEIPF